MSVVTVHMYIVRWFCVIYTVYTVKTLKSFQLSRYRAYLLPTFMLCKSLSSTQFPLNVSSLFIFVEIHKIRWHVICLFSFPLRCESSVSADSACDCNLKSHEYTQSLLYSYCVQDMDYYPFFLLFPGKVLFLCHSAWILSFWKHVYIYMLNKTHLQSTLENLMFGRSSIALDSYSNN